MLARRLRHRFVTRISITSAAAALIACTACGSTTEPSSNPTSDTYSGVLQPRGAVSRSILASKPGTITLLLNSLSPADVAVGLGLGSYDASGACAMTTTVVTPTDAATPQISMEVQTGTYCVRLYDTGTMVAATTFSIAITHP